MSADAQLSAYRFDLPTSQIAQRPADRRDASRLLYLAPGGGSSHHVFSELADLLKPGDILVRNDARVWPARLLGKRPGGGKVELLLTREEEEGWFCLARPTSRLRPGQNLVFGEGELTARVMERVDDGVRVVFSCTGLALRQAVSRLGLLPLPPYINRPGQCPTPEDRERYQTHYACSDGAVAAPTAGLHFTPGLDQELLRRGVEIVALTLQVGPGTFRPIKCEDLSAHPMEAERYHIPAKSWDRVQAARREGRRVVAVGTTAVRTLEAAAESGLLEGKTNLFIRPGYRFRLVDGLVTNFHLPASTLLVLVSALAGRERVLAAYRLAVAQGYRFYSYGDAMLVWRETEAAPVQNL